MIRRTSRSTRRDTLFPSTTLCRSGPAEDSAVYLSQSTGRGGRGSDDRASDRINDRNRGLTAPGPEEWLNPRQRWFLEALTVGKEVRSGDLRRRWGVSEKTARRESGRASGRERVCQYVSILVVVGS